MNKQLDIFPVLETNRIRLRRIEKGDAHDIFKYLSDKEVMKHYGTEPFQTVDEAIRAISRYESLFTEKRGIRWGITLKGDNKVIGSCVFYNMVSEHYRTDIGFVLSKNFWGQGIAQEALKAAIKYGFEYLNINRIEAVIEPPNVASQKLVERLGFLREGLLRSYEYYRGKFDDLYMYSLLKSDFNPDE
ncbi:GNAT family N-acetyltransferase [Heyndrickxia oleronia]|uniref:GNAT family N-acetyltransferase n=1 Tax=Heyndrickxia oleronia TaxID=38875 RepID=UPI001B27414C|nr:GNAT family protein [Heyndrickxia oleronia]GIN42381.1 N-acetyltransferase [Heyndrickxia oleronia]